MFNCSKWCNQLIKFLFKRVTSLFLLLHFNFLGWKQDSKTGSIDFADQLYIRALFSIQKLIIADLN